MRSLTLSTVDSQWPLEEPPYHEEPNPYEPDGYELENPDDDAPLELDEEYWEALTPDDDYEPTPEPGDFWPDDD
jgi:hypothetical protein